MCLQEEGRQNELRKKLFINSECEGKECAAKREKSEKGAGAEATEMWQGVFGFEKVPKKSSQSTDASALIPFLCEISMENAKGGGYRGEGARGGWYVPGEQIK